MRKRRPWSGRCSGDDGWLGGGGVFVGGGGGAEAADGEASGEAEETAGGVGGEEQRAAGVLYPSGTTPAEMMRRAERGFPFYSTL